MKIREAITADIPQLVGLMEQLGYPTTLDKMERRLENIAANPNYHTLVAELDNKVVGMAGLCIGLMYEHDGFYVKIAAFVVDVDYRRKGIGKELIQEAEKWAREQGAIAVNLNSGNREERKGAHQFYQDIGYYPKSTGFTKSLVE